MAIPIVGLIFAIVILVQVWFMKGTDGPNRFGEDPSDPAAVVRQTVVAPNPLASVKSWSALFDKNEYGVMVLFVVFFVLAEIAVWIKSPVLSILFGSSPPAWPFAYYAIQVVAAVAHAAVLLVIFYTVRRDGLLPLFGGATSLLLGIVSRLLLQNIQVEDVTFGSPFTVTGILFSFLYGFLFMGALVFAVRRWGVTLQSLVLGAVSAELIFQVVVWFIHGFSLYSFVNSITTGAIYGALIYAAFYLHFRSREIALAPATATTLACGTCNSEFYEPKSMLERADSTAMQKVRVGCSKCGTPVCFSCAATAADDRGQSGNCFCPQCGAEFGSGGESGELGKPHSGWE